MSRQNDPPLAGRYWPMALIVLLTTCPSLINSTALPAATPSIAADLHALSADVSWVPLIGDAALALGAVIGADLTTRFRLRPLFFLALGLYTAGSFLAAAAFNLPVELCARVAQGFGSGLLLLISVPPLLSEFPDERRPTSVGLLVIGFFGAATAGPIIGGIVAGAGWQRGLFAVDGLLGLLTAALSAATMPRKDATGDKERPDALTFALAAAGLALFFYGAGELTWRSWNDPLVFLPAGLGAVALTALLVREWRKGDDALLPIAALVKARPLLGILGTTIAGVAFTGTTALAPLFFLQKVRGLDPQSAGFFYVGALLASLVAALVVAYSFGKPWLVGLAFVGLAVIALALWRLTAATAATSTVEVVAIVAALGLGGGLAVTPGILTAALTLPKEKTARAIGAITLYRLAAAFVATVPLTHAVMQGTMTYAARLAAARPGASLKATDKAVQVQALVEALHDVETLVFWVVVVGFGLCIALYLGDKLAGRQA